VLNDRAQSILHMAVQAEGSASTAQDNTTTRSTEYASSAIMPRNVTKPSAVGKRKAYLEHSAFSGRAQDEPYVEQGIGCTTVVPAASNPAIHVTEGPTSAIAVASSPNNADSAGVESAQHGSVCEMVLEGQGGV
jgi:hypothetical protein